MTNLDQSQLDFCQSDAQNIRLLAPAGCGKTNSLLYRCREIAERSDNRQRFLIVTFTRTAAAELKERLIREPQFESIRDATVNTLNAYGNRRIRDRVRSSKLLTNANDKHFAMMNQLRLVWNDNPYIEPVVTERGNNARTLMDVMDSMKSMGFDHRRDITRKHLKDRMIALLDQGLLPKIHEQFETLTRIGVLESPNLNDPDFYNRFYKFWIEATGQLIGQSTFTFEDQKYWTYLDLTAPGPDGKPQRPLSGAARYDHVIVDEFQDINPLDLALIKAIVDRNQATLTIVGDDDQAIFEWRGATPHYILKPKRHFGAEFKDHILEVNYRSPKNIVELSQRLIANNENRVHKKVRATEGASTAQIEIKETSNIHERLEYVSDIVKNTEPGKVAVIGRLRRQLIPHQIHFASDGAPFKIATDLDIFSSRAFDDFVSLLEIWGGVNERQRPAQAMDDAIRICDFIRRFPLSRGDKSNLRAHLQKSKTRTTAETIMNIEAYDGPNIKRSNEMHLQMHEIASDFANSDSLSEAIRIIQENFHGLRFDYEKGEQDIYHIAPPLEQLAQIVESEDLDADDLIERIDTSKEQIQEYRTFEEESDHGDQGGMLERPLHLMTATRSKGKEFDTVVILDAVDGIWPYRKTNDQQQLEAERRLFYVAFTRARKRVVFLTEEDAPISPFVEELGLAEATE